MCTYIPLKVEEGHIFNPSEIWQLYLNGFFIYDFFSAQNKGKNQGKFGHRKSALKTEPMPEYKSIMYQQYHTFLLGMGLY